MIPLHPLPHAEHPCPHCEAALAVRDWHMPGMRTLADLECSKCGRQYYGDLPSGHGLYTPLLVEKETGRVHDSYGTKWFSKWLRQSYAHRASTPLPFAVEEHRPLRGAAVLLNCLDALYGHCLLKLLNAQYYLDRRPDLDVIVMIPRFLKWMVPDGIAQAWVVDLPLRRGTEWNDWLAAEVKRRVSALQTCSLSVAFSHPHPADYTITRFTRVEPFRLDEWASRLARPVVTFVWRDDRVWDAAGGEGGVIERTVKGFRRRWFRRHAIEHQAQQVGVLAVALRRKLRALDFAVVGPGTSTPLPPGVTDLRNAAIDAVTERTWCERYAASHVVVGVHGSNMLLPSAHAGAAVELVPSRRWGNIPQATLFRGGDLRLVAFRYRYCPLSTGPGDLAATITALLEGYPSVSVTMARATSDHSTVAVSATLLRSLRARSAGRSPSS